MIAFGRPKGQKEEGGRGLLTVAFMDGMAEAWWSVLSSIREATP